MARLTSPKPSTRQLRQTAVQRASQPSPSRSVVPSPTPKPSAAQPTSTAQIRAQLTRTGSQTDVLQKEALASLRTKYPDLFKTREQIEKEQRAGATQARQTRKLGSFIDALVQRNERIVSETLPGEMDRVLGQKVEQEIQKINEQVRGRQTERENLLAAGGPKTAVTEGKDIPLTRPRTAMKPVRSTRMTQEQRSRLNQFEAQAKVDVASDAFLSGLYPEVIDYMKSLEEMPKAERDALFADLEAQANSLVDTAIDQDTDLVKRAFTNRIRELNGEFNFLSENELTQLERKVQDLNRESAKTLADNIENLAQRGALSSGMLRGFADKVLEERAIGVKEAQDIASFNVRRAEFGREIDVGKAELGQEGDILGLERQRKLERSMSLSDILARQQEQSLLAQEDLATQVSPEAVARLERQRVARETGFTPEGIRMAPTSLNLLRGLGGRLPTPENITQTITKEGTSFRTQTPEEAKRVPTGVGVNPNLAKTLPRQAVPITPTTRKILTSTIQQRAAARGAARLARL